MTADDAAVLCRSAQGPNAMATVKLQVDAAKLAGRRQRADGAAHSGTAAGAGDVEHSRRSVSEVKPPAAKATEIPWTAQLSQLC